MPHCLFNSVRQTSMRRERFIMKFWLIPFPSSSSSISSSSCSSLLGSSFSSSSSSSLSSPLSPTTAFVPYQLHPQPSPPPAPTHYRVTQRSLYVVDDNSVRLQSIGAFFHSIGLCSSFFLPFVSLFFLSLSCVWMALSLSCGLCISFSSCAYIYSYFYSSLSLSLSLYCSVFLYLGYVSHLMEKCEVGWERGHHAISFVFLFSLFFSFFLCFFFLLLPHFYFFYCLVKLHSLFTVFKVTFDSWRAWVMEKYEILGSVDIMPFSLFLVSLFLSVILSLSLLSFSLFLLGYVSVHGFDSHCSWLAWSEKMKSVECGSVILAWMAPSLNEFCFRVL